MHVCTCSCVHMRTHTDIVTLSLEAHKRLGLEKDVKSENGSSIELPNSGQNLGGGWYFPHSERHERSFTPSEAWREPLKKAVLIP